MPRRRAPQPNRGDQRAGTEPVPAQPVAVATGQAYGQAKAQTEAQQTMPLPDVAAASAAARPDPMVAATQALAQLPPPPDGGLLGMPTERPDEPITAGLSTGPGPGPEAIRPQVKGPVTTTLERLADTTGDPVIAAMAATAARRRA